MKSSRGNKLAPSAKISSGKVATPVSPMSGAGSDVAPMRANYTKASPAKKGTTVNIIMAPSAPPAMPGLPPGAGVMPAAAAPVGPPVLPAGPPPMPPAGMKPPGMKRGGKVVMHAGAGGGLGRLEKTRKRP